jgi:uncharacterized membrane protein YvlD (DUF360 family)
MIRIIFSIIINAWILYAIAFLLSSTPDQISESGEIIKKWLEAWVIVTWWWQAYLLGWAILWIINITIKPILKILTLPLILIFLSLVTLIVNWTVLYLLDYVMTNIIAIPWISYTFNGWTNFAIAVAIFTILNMFYSLLFSKK